MPGNERGRSSENQHNLGGDRRTKRSSVTRLSDAGLSQNKPGHSRDSASGVTETSVNKDRQQPISAKSKVMAKSGSTSEQKQDMKGKRGSTSTTPLVKEPQAQSNQANTNSDHEKDEFKCPDCKLVCKDDEAALECEFCERWFHAECQKVTDQLYQAIQADSEAGTNMIHWYCNTSCNFFAKKMVSNMFSLRKDLDAVAGAVGGISTRLEKIESGELPQTMEASIRNIVKEEVQNDEVKQQIQKFEKFQDIMNEQRLESLDEKCKQIEEVNKFMNNKAKEQQMEAEDRTRRQTNLIIFDLPESNAPTGEMKKNEDKQAVGQILEEIGVEQSPTFIKRLFRRGRRDEADRQGDDNLETQEGAASSNHAFDPARKTPLLVKFENQSIRDEALRKFIAAKRDAEEDEYEGEEERLYLTVKMKRDMTRQERDEDFAIYQAIKTRREESKNAGDHFAKWVVRHGRIVNIGRYPRRNYLQRNMHQQ